ncbi:MAG TPA: hypothetical protein VND93_21230, partial [Myxococcales bacterium]|nr:hypothetical protein [Myxococcales bacterium]
MRAIWPVLGALLALGCQGCRRESLECGEDAACFAARLGACTAGAVYVDRERKTRWVIGGYAGPECHVVATRTDAQGVETHCVYPTEIASGWRAGAGPDPWHGAQADEACYAGDGGCVGIPVLAPLCVLGDCVAGRWTYTCELTPGGRVEQCEGTKAMERAPADAGCWLKCEHGKPKVECYADRRGKP